MLQQTVVNAVIPHFEKWMKIFPDVASLAKTEERNVLRRWEGLGYYSRARNIHKAARIIMKDYNGKIPDAREEILKLPGIGPYTASAILSIAFGKKYAVLDANVRRVGRRLFGMKNWDRKQEKLLEEKLSDMIPEKNPGDFNEAIMELGQIVCRTDNPSCPECPLNEWCKAFRHNLQDVIPGKKKTAVIRKTTTLLIIIYRDRILLKKKSSGLLRGLWKIPGIEHGKSSRQYIERRFGKISRSSGELKTRIHYYTKYRDELKPEIYHLENHRRNLPEKYQWVPIENAGKYPVPSVYRKILEELESFMKRP